MKRIQVDLSHLEVSDIPDFKALLIACHHLQFVQLLVFHTNNAKDYVIDKYLETLDDQKSPIGLFE